MPVVLSAMMNRRVEKALHRRTILARCFSIEVEVTSPVSNGMQPIVSFIMQLASENDARGVAYTKVYTWHIISRYAYEYHCLQLSMIRCVYLITLE